MARKNLAKQLMDQRVLSLPYRGDEEVTLTPQDKAELYKVQKEWEEYNESALQRRKEDRKLMAKIGLLLPIPLGIIMLAGSFLVNNPAEAIGARIWGSAAVLFPPLLIAGSWLAERIAFGRDLRKTLKSKEKELLKAREKAMEENRQRLLREAQTKRLAEIKEEHERLGKRVEASIDASLLKRLKNNSSQPAEPEKTKSPKKTKAPVSQESKKGTGRKGVPRS